MFRRRVHVLQLPERIPLLRPVRQTRRRLLPEYGR